MGRNLSDAPKLIAQEFRRHDELASSSALSNYEKEEYSILATEAADEVEYQMSLRTLTLLLHKHHNVAPIVIIDEYDTPIQQGHVSGFTTRLSDSCETCSPAA